MTLNHRERKLIADGVMSKYGETKDLYSVATKSITAAPGVTPEDIVASLIEALDACWSLVIAQRDTVDYQHKVIQMQDKFVTAIQAYSPN